MDLGDIVKDVIDGIKILPKIPKQIHFHGACPQRVKEVVGLFRGYDAYQGIEVVDRNIPGVYSIDVDFLVNRYKGSN